MGITISPLFSSKRAGITSTHNICLFKVDKKCTGCNLKIVVLLDCVLTGVCAVITDRLNMVLRFYTEMF